MIRILSILVLGFVPVFTLGAPQTQTPSGRVPPSTSTGTASISGVVLEAESNTPVRHARVATTVAGVFRAIYTDDAGGFRLDGLGAGKYALYVSEPRHLQMEYGAARPNAPGILIAVVEGQHVTGATIRLAHGAAVSGRISTPDGQPVAGVEVRLMKWGYSAQTGERTLVSAPIAGRATDARGVFRLFGVPPGSYLVATTGEPPAVPDGPQSIGSGDDDVSVMTHADVVAALAGVTTSGGGPSRGSQTPQFAPHVRRSATLFPGVTRAADAESITLMPGEERSGIDFPLLVRATATIRGRLVTRDGGVPVSTTVYLHNAGGDVASDYSRIDVGRTKEDGTFSLPSVLPGDYVVSAQAVGGAISTADRSNASARMLTATARVSVDGYDISDLILTLEPGITVSGRVEFEGAGTAPAVASALRIGLTAVLSAGEVNVGAAPVSIDQDGRFQIKGVMPGRYVAELTSRQDSPSRLWLKAAIIGGRNAADTPVDIGTSDISALAWRVSDRASELTGTVLAPTGEPSRAYWVVVFSASRGDWRPRSRRIRSVRPSEGVFRFAGLPPGDYLLAAVVDLEPGQAFDPAFLESVAPAATHVSLAEGATITQDLRVR